MSQTDQFCGEGLSNLACSKDSKLHSIPSCLSIFDNQGPKRVFAHPGGEFRDRFFLAQLRESLTIPAPIINVMESKSGQNSTTLPSSIRITPISLISMSFLVAG